MDALTPVRAALGGALLALPLLASSAALAADRSPLYIDVNVNVGVLPGLAVPWKKLSLSGDIKLGAGSWTANQRVGLFGNVGTVWRATRKVQSIGGLTQPVSERLRLTPFRAGMKLNLSPRPDYVQVNVLAFGGLAPGRQLMLEGDQVVGGSGVLAVGAGVGAELLVVSRKRNGFTAGVNWSVEPALLGSNNGFMAQGLVLLGGPEVQAGWVMFLGGPK